MSLPLFIKSIMYFSRPYTYRDKVITGCMQRRLASILLFWDKVKTEEQVKIVSEGSSFMNWLTRTRRDQVGPSMRSD